MQNCNGYGHDSSEIISIFDGKRGKIHGFSMDEREIMWYNTPVIIEFLKKCIPNR